MTRLERFPVYNHHVSELQLNKDIKILRLFRWPGKSYPDAVIYLSRLMKPFTKMTKPMEGIREEKTKACGMDITVLIPEEERGTLIDIHGGAFAFPLVPYMKKIAALYALSGLRVLLPEYPLLPENRYPIAIDSLTELAEKTANLIAISGSSAGGFLASKVAEKLSIKPALMLLYPVVRPFADTESMRQFTDTPMWNSRLNTWMWRKYIADHQIPDTSYVGIKKAFVETAEFDPLRDEGKEEALRMIKQGVDVTLSETKGTVHGYDILWKKESVIGNIGKRISFLKTL